MKTSKKFGMSALAAVAALGLAACSSSVGSDADASSDLQWGFWSQSDSANAAWEALADEVTTQYPSITVTMSNPPFADYFTKLQSQLAASDAPCIVSMQSLRLPAFAAAMQPIDELLAETDFDSSEWQPAALDALKFDGKQYALPFGLSTMQLYYNKDMFKAAGVAEPTAGWTIADFESAAEQITTATGKPAFGQSFSDLHMFSMLNAYNGAIPVSADGELQLTDPKVVEAFEWYSGLSTTAKVASVPSSSSDVPWGEQQLVAGNVAMAVDGSWNMASNASDAGFDMGVVSLPVGSAGPGTFSANSGFGISQSCEHKEDAIKAISVLTSEDAAVASAVAGTAPGRVAGLDEFFTALGTNVGAEYAAAASATTAVNSEIAVPFLTTTKWDQTTKEIGRQFILAYTGDQSAAETLANTQAAFK